LQCKRA